MSEYRRARVEFSVEPEGVESILAAATGGCLGLALGVLGLGAEWLTNALSTSVDEVEARLRSRVGQTYAARLEEYLAVQNAARPRRHLATQTALSVRAADALARAEATLDGLRDRATLTTLADRWHKGSLEAARDGLTNAVQYYERGRLTDALQLAQQTEARLVAVAYDSCRRLEAAHRHVMSGVTALALQDMGYTVDLDSGDTAVALWATKGHQTLAAVVTGAGRLEVDTAGFDGLLCSMESERLFERLAARGLRVRREVRLTHGRSEGGAMTVAAASQARKADVRPAQALLSAAGAALDPWASGGSQGESNAARSGRRLDIERTRKWLWAQRMHEKPGAYQSL